MIQERQMNPQRGDVTRNLDKIQSELESKERSIESRQYHSKPIARSVQMKSELRAEVKTVKYIYAK